MSFYKFLLTSCAVLLVQTGCDNSSKEKKSAADQSVKVEEKASSEKVASEVAEQKSDSAANEKVAEPEQKDVEQVKNADDKNSSEQADERIAVKFENGKTIPQSEIIKRIKLLPSKVQKLPFSQLYNLVLFVMIQEELAYSEAINSDFGKSEVLKKQLEQLSNSIAQQYYLDSYAKKSLNDDEVKKQYQDLIKDFKSEEEIGLRHILCKTKEEADEIIKKLKAGESFDELQQSKSLDRKTIEKKGFLGYFRKSQLPKAELDEILKTPVGSIVSAPILVPKTGYSILMVSEKRQSEPAALEKVKDKIENILIKKHSLVKIGQLYKDYDVKIYGPDGQLIPYKGIDERLDELRKKGDQKDMSKEDIAKEESVNKLKDDSIVAKIGTKSIVFSEVAEFIKERSDLFKGLSPYDVYTSAVEEYVNQHVLTLVIEKENIISDQNVKSKLEEAKRALISQKYLLSLASKMLTDEEVRKGYDNLVSKIDKDAIETRLRVIPVGTQENAEKALAALKSGKSFDAVLNEFTSDQRFKDKGGDMGYLKNDQISMLSTDLAEAVKKAPKATILPKAVEVNGQILVVRVDDKRKAEIPTFQQVKPILKKNLLPEFMVKATLKIIEKSNIDAKDFNGNKLDLSEKELEKTLGGVGPIA